MAIRFSVEHQGVTRTYDLKRSVVTFGRSHSCTVQVDDPALSRTHSQLEVEEGSSFIRDLNSRNGTKLNGEIVNRAQLTDGDQVTIGNATITYLGQDEGKNLVAARSTARWTARLFSKKEETTTPRLGDDEDKEVRRLRRLLELNRKIAAELEPERVLTAILDSAVEFVDAERGFLVTVEGSRLYIPVARDFWKKDIASPAFEVSRSIALEVVKRGASVISEDASEDRRFDEMVSVHNLKIRSVLCVPLKDQGRTIGAIYLDNRFTRGSFSADDIVAIEAFADQAAISLVNSGVFEKTREISAQWKDKAQANERELDDVRAQLEQLERADGLRHAYRNIIGRSEAMRKCLALVDRVTDTDLPVLIGGESGTGKELIARALHENGPRGENNFVALNCAAFSAGLIEGELFGHVRGAFTGSVGERAGLFEEADGGTLFLDEVGDMPVDQQKRLLRVLETGELRRLGDTVARHVDVRVISATHQDLADLMADGRFREDLYYRLKGVAIEVPPLRDRAADIPVLAEHFLRARSDRDVTISAEAMKILVGHRWPGNVRELKNEIDRLGVMVEGEIRPEDLTIARAASPLASRLPESLKAHVEAIERKLILRALEEHEGNKTKAAEALGLSRLGLRKKMARYEVE